MANQEIFSGACPRAGFLSPVPHGGYVAANLNYSKLHPAIENTKFYSWIHSNMDFGTLAHRELTVCPTKSVHKHFSHCDKRGSGFSIPFTAPLIQESKCKTLVLPNAEELALSEDY